MSEVLVVSLQTLGYFMVILKNLNYHYNIRMVYFYWSCRAQDSVYSNLIVLNDDFFLKIIFLRQTPTGSFAAFYSIPLQYRPARRKHPPENLLHSLLYRCFVRGSFSFAQSRICTS